MRSKIFFIIIFCFQVILAQVNNEKELSGSLSLSLSLNFTEGRTDYADSKIGFGMTGSAEYFIPSPYRSKFGLRLMGGKQNVYGKDNRKIPELMRNDMYIGGAGINYAYRIVSSAYPFIYIGISNLWFEPKFDDGRAAPNSQKNLYDKKALSFDVGAGLRYFISEVIAIQGETQLHYPNTDYLDDYKSGAYDDTYLSYSLGISFVLNRNNDDDDDGVENKNDPCPEYPEDFDGYEDEDGCPDYDNDNDGITDQNDKCPGIAEDRDGYKDDDGCPDPDNDNDGIPDLKDQCPDEPEDFDGYNDMDGCMDKDNDNDGIADTEDKCTNAAEDKDNFQDEDGCPDPDNDNDGILDINDKCPDRPENINGFKDTDGCPDTIPRRAETKPEESKTEDEITLNTSQREFVIGGNIFKSDKGTELKSSNIPELDRFVKMIQNDISSRWRIEVYMDSGPASEMVNTSKQRADAVLQYFVSKGLPSFQFQTFGMGSRDPVASNNTSEGRSKNRRVVIRKYR